MPDLTLAGDIGGGGGHTLRAALSLSAITGKSFRMTGVRAERDRPGLLRRHLTIIKAVAEMCGATVRSAELGSTRVEFRPRAIRGGTHEVSFGAAASATLVCQTLVPIMLRAPAATEVVCRGATHRSGAPTFEFVDMAYLGALRRAGLCVDATLEQYGFHPAGGGCYRVSVSHPANLGRIELVDAGKLNGVTAWATFAHLPFHVAKRELDVIRDAFDTLVHCQPQEVKNASSPGNVVTIRVDRPTVELVAVVGAPSLSAEAVAGDAVARAKELIFAKVPVGGHLADQLLLPMAVAGGGAFRTLPLTAHAQGTLALIEAFGAARHRTESLDDGSVRVSLS